MSLFRHITRLFYIDRLIERKATGTPEQFAQKNRLSKSGLMKVLKDMKDLGYPIEYDNAKKSYCYKRERGGMKRLILNLHNIEGAEMLTRKEMIEVGKSAIDYNNLCYSETHIFEKC